MMSELSEKYMRAVAAQGDFTPCERTVRMCIEAIVVNTAPKQMMDSVYSGALSDAKETLQALLPDPAKALVEEFAGSGTATKAHVTDDGIRPFIDPLEFARWLIGTGRIRSGE